MKKLLLVTVACAFMMAGCVKEELDPCPGGGRVNVRLYVEQFGGPLATRATEYPNETKFNSRIQNLHYYLFLENKLVEHGEVSNLTNVTGAYYLFSRDNLAFGNYKLAVCANCDGIEVRDLPATPEQITLDYPGINTTEDYFMTLVPFTVDCDCTTIAEGQLKYLNGVVRYTFTDLPAGVTAVEVGMDHLARSGRITGVYTNEYSYTKRVAIATPGEPFLVTTYPTGSGETSTWSVRLYDAAGNVVYENLAVASDVTVVRNRILDLGASFVNGEIQFTINILPEWDDSQQGGSSEIE